jgi:hypothetical protein
MDIRPGFLLAVAMAIAMVAVGCGGDSDDAADNAPPSKAEFVKQANAVCERERAGLMERVAEFERRRAGRRPEPGADVVHFVYLPTIEAQIFRIEELDVPRGEQTRIDTLLDAERFALDAVAVMPRVPSIAVAERNFAEADKQLRAYGLSSCANGNET